MRRLIKDGKNDDIHVIDDENGWMGKWTYINGELAYMDRFGYIFTKDKIIVVNEKS